MTKNKEFMSKVAQLGCIACQSKGLGYSPACCHHMLQRRDGIESNSPVILRGRNKVSDFEVIPLCHRHHQEGPTAIHKSPKFFEEIFGTEEFLYRIVCELLDFPFIDPNINRYVPPKLSKKRVGKTTKVAK